MIRYYYEISHIEDNEERARVSNDIDEIIGICEGGGVEKLEELFKRNERNFTVNFECDTFYYSAVEFDNLDALKFLLSKGEPEDMKNLFACSIIDGSVKTMKHMHDNYGLQIENSFVYQKQADHARLYLAEQFSHNIV